MSRLLLPASLVVIPATSILSVIIYLSSPSTSPFIQSGQEGALKLPIHHGEALDGTLSDEPKDELFDMPEDPGCQDGTPIREQSFWNTQRILKISFLLALLPAATCNILILVINPAHLARRLSWGLLPSHVASMAICLWSLRYRSNPVHWATTIHLCVATYVQFLIVTTHTLLPTSPAPGTIPASGFVLGEVFPALETQRDIDLVKWSRYALPILHIIPTLIISCIRRGPHLRIPVEYIYPERIIDAIPANNETLNSSEANVTIELSATVPEWLTFSYATPVVMKGNVSESMEIWDLPVLQASLRALPEFKRILKTYVRPKARLGRWEGFNLLWRLAQANTGALVAQSLLAAATAVFYYVPHYLLQLFIMYLEGDPARSEPAWGWLLAFGLFITNAIVYIASGVLWSLSTTVLQAGIKLQLNTMLFGKTLVKKDIAASGDAMDPESKADDKKEGGASSSEGDDESVNSKAQIMTLFTVDVDRVTEFVFHEFALIDAPIEIAVATIFLLKLLGTSALFGLLATLLSVPLTHLASKAVITAQEGLMKSRDRRTALMNELLQGIRMLKFMAWERAFERRIHSIRKTELFWQARNYQIEVGFDCLWSMTPVLVTVVSFLHYTLVRGETLTPSTAFTAIAVFAELRYALSALPETLIQAMQGFVSCRRIEKYLSQAEIAPPSQSGAISEDIRIIDATITWPKDDHAANQTADEDLQTFSLYDVDLQFPKERLSLICGRLGSGKSLLLAGLLGEADIVKGSVMCPRSGQGILERTASNPLDPEGWVLRDMVAYVPQQAWLQNASIKDNIIFSSPWNAERYQNILEACSLLPDLQVLEDGDETEIGEKGLNLSGGQKARVSLARAVYSRAGLLILDDVLSAVDAHTARALLDNCLQGDILRGRTVLLVSHHTALVAPIAAYVVALEKGTVKFAGSRMEFVEQGLVDEFDVDVNEDKIRPSDQGDARGEKGEKTDKKEEVEHPSPLKASHKSVVSIATPTTTEPNSETSSLAPEDDTLVESDGDLKKQRTPRKLMEDEKRATGRIAVAVWKKYFSALGGKVWWTIFIGGLVVAMLVPVAEKGWLEVWTGSEGSEQDHSATFYVVGYALISTIGVFASNIPFAVIYYGSIQASKKLHNVMLETVLFATLRFHDTTSRGRILNRFGKDIEGLDSSTADNFVRSVLYGLNVIVTFSSIAYVGGLPIMLAGVVILSIYYQAGSTYNQTSRDMRRLDSVTRSPLYSLFGETVAGIAVIRAFGAGTVTMKHMFKLQNCNLVAYAWTWMVNRWLSARFNILSSVVVGVTAVAVLISPSVTAAMAGFALAFASTVSHDLLFLVRRFVQLEQSMVALERIKEYSELELEPPEHIEPPPPKTWPLEGVIKVQNLEIRYAPDLPNVLHGLTFEVNGGEKIGIVGATGCGKSTLALSFFRFVEPFRGHISIDGIDITEVGLTDLRGRVTIIPQDPTILSGTLRSTLDVFDEYNDAEIYEALRRVHLLRSENSEVQLRNVDVFQNLSNPVSEGGDNFSSGEKQLLCMARAILRRNKVLFMDEATASIDYETDELISQTIREEFHEATILTIAHRIRTIIDFDRVLVMDRGRIAEYDTPANLLRDHRSKFYSLCKATGRTEFKTLKALASKADKQRSLPQLPSS